MSKFLLIISTILVFSSCKYQKQFDTSKSPMVLFALEKVRSSYESKNISQPEISWFVDSTLEEQAYNITVLPKRIEVKAGDEHGLMYAGFEIAEQIELHGKAEPVSHNPFVKNRGLKINIPLDARTPSYDDSGDAALKNVSTMWDFDFWTQYLDQLALNRFNVLSFWNPHPFPSLIKLEEYHDISLEDVYTTNYKPTGYENEMGDPQLISTVVFDHLELVKK